MKPSPFLLFLLVPLLSIATATADLFKDGDRWSVVGDSITQNGTYHSWIYLYYATRFPQLNLTVENGGISGDSASGAIRRYSWDIQPRQPTVATVMLGMNDVARGLYTEETPSAELLTQRESVLENYRKNLTALAKRLQSGGARVVFVTPSPFDETAELDKPRQTGVNGALAQCAAFMKQLAAEIGATVIDLHSPLTALNQSLQAADPKATIIGPDRIHPAAPGHFAMAYHFLKGQGAPGTVSDIEIDGTTGKVIRAENATVSNLSADAKGIQFKCLEQALPFPVPDEVRQALDWVPFQDELNRQILRVSRLTEDSYTLFIDDQRVGKFSKEDLATGVNLAGQSNTPQARQAAKVLELIKKWQTLSANGDRGIAQPEHFEPLKDIPHPVSFETAAPVLNAQLATLDETKDAYGIRVIKRYLQVKPRQEQTRTELKELAGAIRSASQPEPHSYHLVPAPNFAALRPKPERPTPERIAQIAAWLSPKPGAFCPPASNRAFWDKVGLDRAEILKSAEALLGEPIPALTEELYKDLQKTGQRQSFEKPFNKRLQRANDLALAECLEMKGRFLAPLREIVSEILAETTWVMPTHDWDQTALLGKHNNVDLGVVSRATSLATISQWLGDQLGQELNDRMRSEIRKRAVDPYLARTYDDSLSPFVWMNNTNNWNAVCHAGVVYAAQATVEDRETRARVDAGAASYIVKYLNGFTPDGYCSEGIGYWNYGFGNFVLLAETLLSATHGNLDLYADPGVAADAVFPLRIELAPNLFPSFSDNSPSTGVESWVLSLLSRRYDLPASPGKAPRPATSLDLFLNPPAVAGPRQTVPELTPLRGYFPEGGVLVSRPTDPKRGLAAAMKGGHNNEHHNHNDIGSYVLAVDEGAIMGDVGGERYTQRTFTDHRYESNVLNSYGHPVPVVNGQLQATGAQARAIIKTEDFSDKKDVFSLDLTRGYPVPGLTNLTRTFTYHRDGKTSFEVLDEMNASEPLTFGTTLMTFGTVEKKTNDTIQIQDGRRGILVRFNTGGAPWTAKEEMLEEDMMVGGRKPRRFHVELNEPAKTARIQYSVTPIPSTADNASSPLASFPDIKAGAPGSIRLQGEAFSAESGGSVERVSRPGTDNQAISMWDNAGHSLEWKFSTPAEGRYFVAVRYANGTPTETTRLFTLDDQALAGAANGFDFPTTSGWGHEAAEWQDVLLTRKLQPYIIALEPGEHSLRLSSPRAGGMNLDWIELVPLAE